MEQRSLKTQKEECEKDIKYIQTNILPSFIFDFSSTIDPDASYKYYGQLHGLLSALIYIHYSRELERLLMFHIDHGVQQPEKTIIYLSKHCELKTLGFDEQFAVFRLLNSNDKRTLLQLSMEDCDTFSFEALWALFNNGDYKHFHEDACKVKYSASKVSRIAQAICLHNSKIADFLYHHIIETFLQRIESYNKDFMLNTSLTQPWDYLGSAHLLEMRPGLLGLNIEPITAFFNQFEMEYGSLLAVKYSKISIPSSIEKMLPRIVWLRKKFLELYISDITDELKGKSVEAVAIIPAATTPPPPSSNEEILSLKAIPKHIDPADVDAFCAAFANHCIPNNPKAIKYIFWNIGQQQPQPMIWRSNKNLFIAFIHYAYKDHDLPYGTEEMVKKLFTCKGKPLNIAGYAKSKYESCYRTVETELRLNRQQEGV